MRCKKKTDGNFLDCKYSNHEIVDERDTACRSGFSVNRNRNRNADSFGNKKKRNNTKSSHAVFGVTEPVPAVLARG